MDSHPRADGENGLEKAFHRISLLILQLELHSYAPEDILALEIWIACGSIVEERGIPLLGELYRQTDSCVECVPDWRGAPVGESRAAIQVAVDGIVVLEKLMLPGEAQLRNHCDALGGLPGVGSMRTQAVEHAGCVPIR